MLVRPQTLSLITTHQCTAACDNCCFTCSPKITKAIPVTRLFTLIDEAAQIPSIRVVVFTGGECFLLKDSLDELVAHATGYGLVTRCVTNGFWATTRQQAQSRVNAIRNAGLQEINFSTGTFHARYVPVQRIINGAIACLAAGMTTLINAEICNESDFDVAAITRHADLEQAVQQRRLIVQRSAWIENGEGRGKAKPTHLPANSRFNEQRKDGCHTVLNVLSVTPDQHLVACCGLHLESIPDLHLGSVAEHAIPELIAQAPDDLLKIWIHLEGPARVLDFVKSYCPDYELPLDSVHPCTTCLHLYRDERALRTVREHYREVEDHLAERYLAQLAILQLDERGARPRHNARQDQEAPVSVPTSA